MGNKKELLFVFAFVLVVALMFFVFALSTIDNPTTGTNHSGTINFSVTTTINASTNDYNVTIYYNESGGAVDTTDLLVTIVNTSANQNIFENSSVIISSLNDSVLYNFSAFADNGSDQEWAVAILNVTVDNTAPNATIINTVVNFGNYSETINLNATVVDALLIIDTVFFNITNSNGGQNETVTLSNPSGNLWNGTLNTSNFIDGTYNITVYGNDSVNNINSSETVHTITFDNTVPSSITIAKSSTTETTLDLTVTIVDALSGIGSACTVDRSGASISGTTANQTIAESSLTCATDYTYVVTCTDLAGNTNSSNSSIFTTNACSGTTTSTSSSSSSSSTTVTWTNTYIASSEQLSEGYTKELAVKNRIKVIIDNKNHYVGVLSLTATTAKIQVSSDPVETTLNIGEESKFDVTNNSFYDVFVKLNGIINSKANITVRQINEAIPEGEPSAVIKDKEGEIRDAVDKEEDTAPKTPDKKKGSVWLWIVIIVLALLIILGMIFKDKIKEMMHS